MAYEDLQNILRKLLEQQTAISDPLLAQQRAAANKQVLANIQKAGVRSSGVGQEQLRLSNQEADRQKSQILGQLTSQNLQEILQQYAADQALRRQKDILEYQKNLQGGTRPQFGLGSLLPVLGAGAGAAIGGLAGGPMGAGLGAQLGGGLGSALGPGVGPSDQIIPNLSGATQAISQYGAGQSQNALLQQLLGNYQRNQQMTTNPAWQGPVQPTGYNQTQRNTYKTLGLA